MGTRASSSVLPARTFDPAQTMRLEVARARSDFRVSGIDTQEELNRAQMLREHLLSTLAMFFGCVALLLARHRIVRGARLLGASAPARNRDPAGNRRILQSYRSLVTLDVFSMVVIGAIAGLALGFWSIRFVEALLYQVKATDARMLALPSIILFTAAFLAAVPAAISRGANRSRRDAAGGMRMAWCTVNFSSRTNRGILGWKNADRHEVSAPCSDPVSSMVSGAEILASHHFSDLKDLFC